MGASKADGLRLAVCTALAVAAVTALGPLCRRLRLPLPPEWLDWAESHRPLCVAVVAAALYALSLVLFPADPPPPEGFVPCGDPEEDGT